MTETPDRIRRAPVGLGMPRAPEAPDHAARKLEQGRIPGIEALDALPGEECATRETRRIDAAPGSARHGRTAPGDSPWRSRREGRKAGVSRHIGGAGRGSGQGWTRRTPRRQDPLPCTPITADRGWDRIPVRHPGRREPVPPTRQRPPWKRRDDPGIQPGLRRMVRCLRRSRRCHRASGPAAAPRRRRSDRRRGPPPARPYRPDPGTHPSRRAGYTAATARAPRPSAGERGRRSPNRPTAETARPGNVKPPVLGKFKMPLTLGRAAGGGRNTFGKSSAGSIPVSPRQGSPTRARRT